MSLQCLDQGGRTPCEGPVEMRTPLSSTGQPFARCDAHWESRLKEQERINRTYPTYPPSDFDPLYAGERWEEEQ